jgi:hypothetical protein
MPVSSSMVMKMTPLAEPSICRTSTRPAALSHLPSRACIASGDYVLVAKVSAQEGDRMAAQAQAHMAIVLDHFAASGHRPECYSRFIDLNRT